MEQSKAARSMSLIFMISIVSVFVSFVKEAVFANFYGISGEADAFTVATQLPVTVFAVIAVAIRTVVIPTYSKKLYQDGKDASDYYVSNLLTIVTLASAVIAAIGVCLSDAIVFLFTPGLSAKNHDLAVSLLRIAFPTVILVGNMEIMKGVLSVHKIFGIPNAAVIIYNLVFILLISFLSARLGIYAAIIGIVAGTVIQFAISACIVGRKVRYRPAFNLKDSDVRADIRRSTSVFIGIGAAEINRIVERMMASFLNEGGIAAISYATRLSSGISTLLVQSVSTVTYPYVAEKINRNDYDGACRIYIQSFSIFILFLFPVIGGAAILSHEIVAIAFARGAFSHSAIPLTATLFFIYVIGILPASLRGLSSNLFYSLGDTKTPMYNSMIGSAINIVLSIVLSTALEAVGLALAVVVSSFVICILLMRAIKKKQMKIRYSDLRIVTVKAILSVAVMIVAVLAVKRVINANAIWTILICTGTGALVYFLSLIILKTSELKAIRNIMWKNKRTIAGGKNEENYI